jgi:hypothetical protein
MKSLRMQVRERKRRQAALVRERALRHNVRARERALRHATQVVGPECAANLIFRCGPCDICGGSCFCRPNDELVAALLSRSKPVGEVHSRHEDVAREFRSQLESLGLACWMGRNRWNMFVVVASAVPDVPLGKWGTPRQVAFTQAFIDEYTSWDETGVMYGYRLP